MRKTDIERVIKQGSIKQKIKLYFTDIAYFNTVGIKTAQIKGSGDTATLDRPEKILTDRERDIIFNSIKEPKDIKYWEELRTWNRAFLMYKPKITAYTKQFDHFADWLSKSIEIKLWHKHYERVINQMLDVVEDKELREKLIETAIDSLSPIHGFREQGKDFLPFLQIAVADDILIQVEVLNQKIINAKEYISGLKDFLNKNLPLYPYKQFVKEAEDKIKANIEKCRSDLEGFTVAFNEMIALYNERLTEEDLITEEKYPPEPLPAVLRYEDVAVEVTDEDIEDIKNAGR